MAASFSEAGRGRVRGGRSSQRLLFALAAVSLLLICSLALAQRANAFLYWTNTASGSIGRAGLNGQEANESFIAGLEEPQAVAVSGGFIYWSEPRSDGEGIGSIGRARLDGTDVEPKFINDLVEPYGLAVSGPRLYWAERAAGKIGYANLDGTEVHVGAYTTLTEAWMIGVSGDQLFYTSGPPSELGEVGRVNLEKDEAVTLYKDEEGRYGPYGLALYAGRVYWSGCPESNYSEIGRVAESGASPEPLLFSLPEPDFACATGLAIGDGHIYWSSGDGEGFIGRSNLEGGQAEAELITGASSPMDIALTEPPTLNGRASAATSLGGAVTDAATLEGAYAPTGTLSYHLYSPTDPTCSGSPVYSEEVPVAGTGAYQTASFTPTAAGTYRWTVSYSGDAGNESASDGCGASGQSVTVTGSDLEITPVASSPGAGVPGAVAKQCTSDRLERIHWRVATGVHVKRIHVMVDGKLYRVLSGTARAVTVSFKGRHAGRVPVKITATGRHGARYSTTRVYQLCTPLHRDRRVRNETLT